MAHHNRKSRALLFLKKNIISILFSTACITASIYYSTSTIFKEFERVIKEQNNKRVSMVLNKYGKDLELLCLVTDCYLITSSNGIEYINNKYDFILPRDDKFESRLIKELSIHSIKPMVINNDLNFFSNTGLKTEIIKRDFVIKITVMFTLLFITGMLSIIITRAYVRRYQDLESQMNINEELRRRLTESVHHELSAPLSAIETNLKAGFMALYPCKHSRSGQCELSLGTVSDDVCEKCPVKEKLTNRKGANPYWNYLNILTSIDQIRSVLDVMANSKHIQYTNGSVSLDKLVDNVSSNKRVDSLNLVKVEVINKHGLENYSLGNGLKNGQFRNILTAMVNNSIEAEANRIIISHSLHANKGFIEIYIRDNGIGVRDKKNRLIKNVKDFKIKYGYSTKVSKADLGTEHNVTSFKLKFFKLFTNIFGNDSEDVKVRGSGLHLNKTILEMAGGSLTLFRNSESGATFKLVVPIKKREVDAIEEGVLI